MIDLLKKQKEIEFIINKCIDVSKKTEAFFFKTINIKTAEDANILSVSGNFIRSEIDNAIEHSENYLSTLKDTENDKLTAEIIKQQILIMTNKKIYLERILAKLKNLVNTKQESDKLDVELFKNNLINAVYQENILQNSNKSKDIN